MESKQLLDDINNDLRQVGSLLYEPEEWEKVFQVALKAICEELNPQLVSLFASSKQGGIEREAVWGIDADKKEIDRDNWIENEEYAPDEGFSGRAIVPDARAPYGKSQHSNHLDSGNIDLKYRREYTERLGFLKCGISVPLNSVHRTFGTIEVINRLDPETGFPNRELDFSEQDVCWLSLLGDRVANALSRLRRRWEDEMVSDIVDRLTAPDNEEKSDSILVCDEIAKRFIDNRYMPYKVCIIRMKDRKDARLKVVAREACEGVDWVGKYDEPRGLGQGLAGQVLETGKPINVRDIDNWSKKFFYQQWIEQNQLKSYLCYPMSFKGNVIGTISLFAGFKYDAEKNEGALLRKVLPLLASFTVLREIRKSDTELRSLGRDEDIAQAEPFSPKGGTEGQTSSEKVESCLLDTKYDFRTAEGIAKETGLEQGEVERILERSPFARKSLVTSRSGSKIYTHKSRPIKHQERLAVIQLVVSKFFAWNTKGKRA